MLESPSVSAVSIRAVQKIKEVIAQAITSSYLIQQEQRNQVIHQKHCKLHCMKEPSVFLNFFHHRCLSPSGFKIYICDYNGALNELKLAVSLYSRGYKVIHVSFNTFHTVIQT